VTGLAGHHVQRAGLGIERAPFPALAGASPEPKFARRAKRQAEHLIEMLLVAVPADAGTDLILSAQRVSDAVGRLPNASTRAARGRSQSGKSSAFSSFWWVKSYLIPKNTTRLKTGPRAARRSALSALVLPRAKQMRADSADLPV
jgi:hypothetical protein